ncbi:hypothetical protein D9613_003768 [Agrocybe pediades]|uniref:Beta-glucuronidase C-terminal domain-containing protein n=1 Tax=Agrocybe pediades TaxID=84607 RepID=A0A8H4VJQ5_9AGAR|nr:hypothetical protein D9613_003768 [Agrocybe pediades]
MRAASLAALTTFSSILSTAQAVTVYGQIPLAQTLSVTSTETAAVPQATYAAYDETQLTPPEVPNPAPATAYTLSLQRDAAAVAGLSIPHVGGSFWGFSVEMSVINQVLGRNSSFLMVPFLNLMANLQERAGGVVIRLGGNTQEFATQVDSLPDGHTFGKTDSGSTQTTKTPAVLYTPDMFYMASNISAMLNIGWFFGIPFNDSVNWRLTIAEQAQNILGSNLLGLQAGNEPDFYQQFGRRQTYSPAMYSNEIQQLIETIDQNPRIPVKNMLLGPSVATGPWTPEQVWETGFIDRFKERLMALTVEHYPNNNCAANFDTGGKIIDPQSVLPDYLTHTAAVELVRPYINSANLAQAAGKPLYMFETNTASCGGFKGVSNSFGAAMWGVDYGMQMAAANFTHGMFHVGGQNVYYNPFTSPPTNQSQFNEWTIGPVYYSAIVLAEAFGKTNTSRIIDLWGNSGSVYTPSYAIYENDVLSKVALFNFIDDRGTGAHHQQVTITIPNAGVPSTVKVKYLLADSITALNNITWAGQTLGNKFEVDGRFRGDLNVTTINCDTAANSCTVPVPSPGFALVFLDNSTPQIEIGQASQTFATTAHTRVRNTATVDPVVLATSNGHSGMNRAGFGSTSHGSVSAAQRQTEVATAGLTVLGAMVLGCAWVVRSLVHS